MKSLRLILSVAMISLSSMAFAQSDAQKSFAQLKAGFLISMIHLPQKMCALSALDPAHQREAIAAPYDMVAGLLMLTAMIVGMFYCLGALQGERRDRSILFWKSLPVSDLTTVLSKASIPFVVLPLLTFAITLATQWIMLPLSSFVLWARSECRDVLDAAGILPDVAVFALPSCDRACPLAVADL